MDRPKSGEHEEKRPAPGMPQAGNGKSLFCIKDPEGYEIVLHVATWDIHIKTQHPEMDEHLDAISRALAEPEVIQKESGGQSTHFYYRLAGTRSSRANDLYVVVVVKRDELAMKGLVKTAYLTRKLSARRETIWISRKS